MKDHNVTSSAAGANICQSIQRSEVDLYAEPALAESDLYYPPEVLEAHLTQALVGNTSLANVAVRTRSKVAKSLVATTLGYKVPTSFIKVQPRFPHPNLDIYVQKSNNLQIWNEELDSSRRYVIIGLDDEEKISAIRVIAGADLVRYDTTGTLTSKFQANRKQETGSRLVNELDTENFLKVYGECSNVDSVEDLSPVARPVPGKVLGIESLYARLQGLIGTEHQDPGLIQERLRGAVLHKAVCASLGFKDYADNGKFPDILSQALEIKLQLSRTVDLGLELPSSDKPIASLDGKISARDIRYAIFYGERISSEKFKITSLVLVSGANFFDEYQQFQGLVSNKKLQLRLPADFFS